MTNRISAITSDETYIYFARSVRLDRFQEQAGSILVTRITKSDQNVDSWFQLDLSDEITGLSLHINQGFLFIGIGTSFDEYFALYDYNNSNLQFWQNSQPQFTAAGVYGLLTYSRNINYRYLISHVDDEYSFFSEPTTARIKLQVAGNGDLWSERSSPGTLTSINSTENFDVICSFNPINARSMSFEPRVATVVIFSELFYQLQVAAQFHIVLDFNPTLWFSDIKPLGDNRFVFLLFDNEINPTIIYVAIFNLTDMQFEKIIKFSNTGTFQLNTKNAKINTNGEFAYVNMSITESGNFRPFVLQIPLIQNITDTQIFRQRTSFNVSYLDVNSPANFIEAPYNEVFNNDMQMDFWSNEPWVSLNGLDIQEPDRQFTRYTYN